MRQHIPESSFVEQLSGKGDIAFIAEITGFNVSYVRKVLDGQRKNDLIIRAAKDVARARQKLAEKYARLKQQPGQAPRT